MLIAVVSLAPSPGLAFAHWSAPGLESPEWTRAWLMAREAWSIEGQLVVLSGPGRGSSLFTWRQFDARVFEIDIAAPGGESRLQLAGKTHYEAATLFGMKEGPPDGFPSELLKHATGADVPVSELPDWLRGLNAWDTQAPMASIRYDPRSRVRSIRKMGCRICFKAWHELIGDAPALPANRSALSMRSSAGVHHQQVELRRAERGRVPSDRAKCIW